VVIHPLSLAIHAPCRTGAWWSAFADPAASGPDRRQTGARTSGAGATVIASL